MSEEPLKRTDFKKKTHCWTFFVVKAERDSKQFVIKSNTQSILRNAAFTITNGALFPMWKIHSHEVRVDQPDFQIFHMSNRRCKSFHIQYLMWNSSPCIVNSHIIIVHMRFSWLFFFPKFIFQSCIYVFTCEIFDYGQSGRDLICHCWCDANWLDETYKLINRFLCSHHPHCSSLRLTNVFLHRAH